MKKYLKLDSRKLSYGEYWNVLHSWKVIIPWTAKLLNIRMNFTSGLPYFESYREITVSEEQFPARAREKLQPMLDQCLKRGFHSPLYFEYQAMHRDTGTSSIALMHPSGAVARVS
jgi:hypothetical protein